MKYADDMNCGDNDKEYNMEFTDAMEYWKYMEYGGCHGIRKVH